MKRYLYFVTFVAALGSLLFGFETAVINGSIHYVAQYFDLSPSMQGFVVSAALIGYVVGALSMGKPADRFGRRYMLKYMAIFFFLSMIGTGLATNLWVFIAARFLGGLAVGGASVISPMYISEIAPAKMRGRLVACSQLAIVLGILVAFFSNYLIDNYANHNWRFMFLAGAIPSGIFYILLFSISRSPRWLVKKGKVEEARAVILKLYHDEDPDAMIKSIQDSLEEESRTNGSNDSIFNKSYRKLIILGIGVGMFNQLSGINIINYYSTEIFRAAGFSGEDSLYQSIYIGIVNLVFTIIGMSLIDVIGRKRLLYIGSIGMPVFLGLFSWFYLSGQTHGYGLLICLLGFIAFFAASQGTVIWVMLSEMFPNNIRARGSAIGSFSHWFFNFLISLVFPVAVSAFGMGYVFMFFFCRHPYQLLLL